MSYIVNGMIAVMDYIHSVTSSWGLSIIGLTLLVRLVILPFTIMQARSSQKLALIQPETQRLQKKYKDDPERLNMEIMELYRKHKVNPASSCLLLVIQFPVLWAVIRALEAHPALKSATFLGIALGRPEKVFLPILAVATTYLAVRLSPTMGGGVQQQGQGQNAMIVAMLGIMWYFSFRFAAAVSIYIITANIAGLFERFLVPRGETAGEGARSK
ncbi:MAG TPA: membrane protein insertase YidC [Firmicutes bacterium]|nr:membrane protein insertase YidC [Candidatus Fermentithermobacillaceae bacterium]